MITIILDSSNTSLTVALASTNKLIESISYEAWQEQSEHMIPELDGLLKKYNYSKEDIEEVIVSIGPGSYTGVRIALTIAKTIGCALKTKVFTVSSLQILKQGDTPSICLINARSERSYFGVYEGNKVIEKDQILSNDDVLKYIENHKNFVVCGNTSYLNIDGYKSNIAKEMLSIKSNLMPVDNPLGVKPVYLRD